MEAALAAGMSVIVVPHPSVDKQLYREASQILDSLTDFAPQPWQLP
jgi:pseudouridine-5'-monophosphatase